MAFDTLENLKYDWQKTDFKDFRNKLKFLKPKVKIPIRPFVNAEIHIIDENVIILFSIFENDFLLYHLHLSILFTTLT